MRELIPYSIVLLSIGFGACQTEYQVSTPNIIPAPQQMQIGEGAFVFDNRTTLFAEPGTLDPSLVAGLLQKFNKQQVAIATSPGSNQIHISIDPNLDVASAGYVLTVSSDKIAIKSKDGEGLFYGVQTMLQATQEISGTKVIPIMTVNDYPRFGHRGLLFDCSRHFFSVKTVKKYIDLLAYYKMNVLHWHLTEDQGWRVEIEQYPKLMEVAAWRTQKDGTRYGGYYTKEQITEVVAYAKERQITVIPEIELPGHSQAALAAYPHLSCIGENIEVANDWGVFKEIYCAGNEETFEFLENVLLEVMDLFPSKYIHIGGDEAPKYRWEHCAKCQARIETEGLVDAHELQSYFIRRIEKFLNDHGRQLIGWDEIMEGGLSPNATVQNWRLGGYGREAAAAGHKVISSPTSHCYLDYDLKSIDLQKVYSFDPIPADLDVAHHGNIIGAEVNMWTERVPDEVVLDQKVFPRLLALAEVTWTYDPNRDFDNFFSRVRDHYPKLSQLGVNYGLEGHPVSFSVTQTLPPRMRLIPGVPDLELSYSINNGKPVLFSDDIDIDFTGIISAVAKREDVPYGEQVSQKVEHHLGIGAMPAIKERYKEAYTGGGDLGLADGLLGSLDFRDGRWQGYYGNHFEATIDLGSEKEIRNVYANFYQYNNSWIFLPANVTTETSADGNSWQALGSASPTKPPEERGRFIEVLGATADSAITARYVRIKADNILKVPDWHEAAGSKAWLFIDEIIIH